MKVSPLPLHIFWLAVFLASLIIFFKVSILARTKPGYQALLTSAGP